jgi:hypothetical protein
MQNPKINIIKHMLDLVRMRDNRWDKDATETAGDYTFFRGKEIRE